MRIHIAIVFTIAAVLLAACGSKSDPNEKNFRPAMVIELAKKPYVCEQASPLSSEKEAKQALEAAGVVQRNESRKSITAYSAVGTSFAGQKHLLTRS